MVCLSILWFHHSGRSAQKAVFCLFPHSTHIDLVKKQKQMAPTCFCEKEHHWTPVRADDNQTNKKANKSVLVPDMGINRGAFNTFTFSINSLLMALSLPTSPGCCSSKAQNGCSHHIRANTFFHILLNVGIVSSYFVPKRN